MGVENALKAAMDWKVRKNLKAGKGEKGTQIIHFKNAFHGRSGYTVSMTNTFHPNKHQYFAKMTGRESVFLQL
jgi:L-lysine 6-transaminase